jgi:hypothetical protein
MDGGKRRLGLLLATEITLLDRGEDEDGVDGQPETPMSITHCLW